MLPADCLYTDYTMTTDGKIRKAACCQLRSQCVALFKLYTSMLSVCCQCFISSYLYIIWPFNEVQSGNRCNLQECDVQSTLATHCKYTDIRLESTILQLVNRLTSNWIHDGYSLATHWSSLLSALKIHWQVTGFSMVLHWKHTGHKLTIHWQ